MNLKNIFKYNLSIYIYVTEAERGDKKNLHRNQDDDKVEHR
jgi:hypothetical protein